MTSNYLPEGYRLPTPGNQAACATREGLLAARAAGTILEGVARLCDEGHNLEVCVGPFTGIIPREEAALGIAEGTTREIAILSRVGKPVCFVVEGMEEGPEGIRPLLSRRAAQRRALDHMLARWAPGLIIPAVVTHLESFGAFVDIGCGVCSMISIENISVSRIPHPGVRFQVGDRIQAVVLDLDPALERIYLTHKELLGTWAENVAQFRPGMTVPGVVRGIKEYGVFVELTPNLSGLAERRGDLREGERVAVYIKSILPERMKIKLLAIDRLPPALPGPLRYYITQGRLEKWRYAPPGCVKVGHETVFGG